MHKTLKHLISYGILAVAIVSCTDFQEEEKPVAFSVDVNELEFTATSSTRSVKVSSGKKWDVASMPQWISLQSISPGISPYEWSANFSASINDDYNRDGLIVIKAGSDAAEVSVTQEGKKGKYIAVETVSLSPTELTLTEGENTTLSYTINPSTASVKDVTWTTSAPSVATVTQSGRIDAVAEGTALITVTTSDGNKTASCAVTVKAKVIPVTGVSLDKTSLTLTEGDVQELIATVVPSNATDKSVTWTSSNSSVASVSTAGVVTAKAAGSATITVKTTDSAKTATCAVTVKAKTIAVTGVSLDKTSLTMTVGDTQSLVATVIPSNATDKSVTWSSNNTSVITVSSSGVVTAKSAGSATITVTTNDGGKTATCAVTVQTIPVSSVSLSPSSLTIVVGSNAYLSARVSPIYATDTSITWSSSDETVATVSDISGYGLVHAKAPGNAIITVTTNDGGKTATCAVTVQEQSISVTGVSLDKTSLSMTEGDTQTLSATVTPSNATDKSVTWSSSNTSVATVSSSGVVSAKSAGTATITVTTNDGSKTATCSITVSAATVAVTGVSMNMTSLSMTVGDTQTLTATVTPSNATDKSVTWSSSNTSVATVSSSGVVTAKSAGSATITVTTNDGGKKATCSVTVNAQTVEVTSITLSQTSATLTYGQTLTLSATVLPADASDKTLVWTSSDNSIASVSEGVVKAGSTSGTATITAKSQSNPSVLATCKVTVTAGTVAVTGVSLDKTSLSMTVGDSQTLTASVTPSNATYKSVTWSSSNTSVATVSSSGVVTAKAAGSTTITVTTNDGGKTATCSVTVQAQTVSVSGVSLNKTSLSMTVGDTQTLTATVTPTNATDKSVTWSSSNTSVATVSDSGIITAKAVGSVTITVTTNDGGKTATCAVTVQAQTVSVSGVSLDKTSLAMNVGDTQALTASVTPSNATDKSVTWSSTNTSVATVSSSGVVAAKATGSATITVMTNDGGQTATCVVSVVDLNGHEYVDLGLPSGLKWATCNVGSSTPEGYGSYFAWGVTTTQSNYNGATYKWFKAPNIPALIKYCSKSSSGYNGFTDKKTVLDLEDDAAHVKFGGTWRIPTDEDWTELRTECEWRWVTLEGVYGYRVTSKKNGNSIFLPAAGFRDYTDLAKAGSVGYYWSSSLDTSTPSKALCVTFSSSGVNRSSEIRYYGRSIRPVSD